MTTDNNPFADLNIPILSADQLLELRNSQQHGIGNLSELPPAPVVEPFVPGYTPRKNGDPVDLTQLAASIEPAKHPDLVAQFAATEAAGPKPFSPDGAMAAIFDLENQVATLQEQVGELTRVVDAMRVRIGAA